MSSAVKFLFLGVFSTAIDYVIYSLLVTIDINYVVAIFFGYSAGLLANYYIARKYIFTSGTKLGSSHKEFIAVVIIAIVGMLLNMIIVKILSYSIWDVDPLHSRVVAIGLVFFWNYFIRKFFVYH